MQSTPSHKPVESVLLCFTVQILFALPFPQSLAQFSRKSENGNTTHTLRITNMQCIDAPYKLTYLRRCKMEQFPNGTVGLNVSIHVPALVNYMEISAKTYYKYTTYRPFMIDWSMEYCRAARVGKFNPATALVMRIIEESLPEFYYPCPHGNRTYSSFWLLEPKFIPSALPSGNYRLDVYFRDSTQTVQFAVQVFGIVRKYGLIG